MSDFADIIARLEKLSGQDRDLDARIAYATKPGLQRCGSLDEWLQTDASKNVLTYTWSIDDALTLVPKGWSWRVGENEPRTNAQAVLGRSHPSNRTITQEASTPAVALCIAAMKARALPQQERER